jgi:heterotetrameric sarcosine oxidase gamma subunit
VLKSRSALESYLGRPSVAAAGVSHGAQPGAAAADVSHGAQPGAAAADVSHGAQPGAAAAGVSHDAQPSGAGAGGGHGAQPGGDRAGRGRALRLGEVADARLLHLGVYPGAAARVSAALLPLLGGPLPDSPAHATTAGTHLIMRIAPDQYWVLGGEPGLDARLRSAIPTDAGSVTSLDGARTRLLIEGPAARALLGRLVAIDLDPTIFPVGGFAQTGIHHVAGLLFRANENRYEFFALRTFAASTWEVLLDAAHPFGYEIASESMI